MDSSELVEQTRADLRHVEQRLADHSFVRGVEAGTVSRRRLALFAGQQQRIIRSDLRSVGAMIARYGGGPSGQFFVAGLETEVAALAALADFAAAVGLDRAGLEQVPPIPGGVAYTHFVAWLAAYASDAEFAAAFLVNLPAWGRNCGRLAAALRARYGLDARQVAFFSLFAQSAPGYERDALAVIQGGLDRGVEPRAIADAARLLQSYELLFWDALQDTETG